MEVDEPQQQHVDGEVAAAPADNQVSREMERAIGDLGEVLAQLEANPQNIPLLRRQVALMRKLQMTDEVLETVLKMASLVMLSELDWVQYFEELIASRPQPLTLDAFVDILERFDQAEGDYMSMRLLRKHMDFLLRCVKWNTTKLRSTEEDEIPFVVDSDVAEFLTQSTVRAMLQGVLARVAGDLSESRELWEPWRDWEMHLLRQAISNGGDSAEQIERIHDLYLARMAVPHSDMASTSSDYSRFVSEYSPNEYEARLVAVTEASTGAKAKVFSEKRHGKTREDLEVELAVCGETDYITRGQVYNLYIDWETDARARNPHPRKGEKAAPSSDPALIPAVFERAIASYALGAAFAQTSIAELNTELSSLRKAARKTGKRGKWGEDGWHDPLATVTDLEEQIRNVKASIRAYKDAEAAVWLRYIGWSEEHLPKGAVNSENAYADAGVAAQTRLRAVRACPQSAAVWTKLLLRLEQEDASLEELTATYEKALGLGLLAEADGPLDSLVDMFVYRAAFESRTEPAEAVEVIATVARGLEAVAAVNKSGDASLKLEKFLLEWFLDQACALVDKPNKSRSASYQFVLLRAGIETRRGEIDEARKILSAAIQRSDLDWPEAVYDAFRQFENVHGDLSSLLETQGKIDKEQEKLKRRRDKQAQEQMDQQYAQYQQYAAATAAAAPAGNAPEAAAPAMASSAIPGQAYAMVVDGADPSAIVPVQNVAAAATTVQEPPASAPAPETTQLDEGDTRQKRDRENSTVLVSGLPKGTEAARIQSFFEDCGTIRETTILAEESRSTDSALVEFKFSDDVALALAKDRKKIGGAEVHVSMLWRSTLFVTNFSKDVDDEQIRAMFSEYGHIMQTRWPSRKYADSRRFCYITMESPAAAQNALALHGTKNKEGFPMNVLISDPAAKSKRVDASNATLFVGGLNSKTSEEEVRELFQPYGTVKTASLGLDKVTGACKGFAFVEMSTEAEAKAALALQGAHFNGRFLKVEISDPSHSRKKADKAERRPARGAAGNHAEGSHATTGETAPVAESHTDRRARTIRLLNVPEGTQEGLLQQALNKIAPVKRLEMFAKQHVAVALLEHAADAGKLLLRAEPFIFEGATITFAEQTRRPPPASAAAAAHASTGEAGGEGSTRAGALAFAPRASRRGGKALGKGRVAPSQDKALPPSFVAASDSASAGSSKTQDDFRDFLVAKNQQRQGKLAEKRSAAAVGGNGPGDGETDGAQDRQQAKKPRTATGGEAAE